MSAQYYEGIGRRKSASARVRLFPGGTGRFIINGKEGEEYLPRLGDMQTCLAPLTHIGQERSYDVSVHVNGGGITGQRDAILLGIARALEKNRSRPPRDAQGGRLPLPRCACQRAQETGIEARAQGADLHQTLATPLRIIVSQPDSRRGSGFFFWWRRRMPGGVCRLTEMARGRIISVCPSNTKTELDRGLAPFLFHHPLRSTRIG